MGRIRILDEVVANKIAAGEVVERPASVLKELIENSLDAGARRIDVAIEGGGASLCRVSDDGDGIEPDDLELALSPHATSKLSSADDLVNIQTLGFRGEALPSIASVSRLILTSLAEGHDVGVRLAVDGGRRSVREEVPFVRGTTVEVRDLFYNVPARRKFQKSTAAETGAAVALVERMALAQPNVHFTLSVNGRERFACSAVKTPRERIGQLFGTDRAEGLLEAVRIDGSTHALVLAESPEHHYPNRLDQYVFVNRRSIVDRSIQHALLRAYEGLLPRGRFPGVFLFLLIEPSQLDVNVHPAKTEVRFADPAFIHSLVSGVVKEALARSSWLPQLPTEPDLGRVGEAIESFRSGPRPITSRHYEIRPISSDHRGRPRSDRTDDSQAPTSAPRDTPSIESTANPLPNSGTDLAAAVDSECGSAAGVFTAEPGIQVLGQYRQTFIIAADAQGLLLADQHTAHERVLYERLRRRTQRVEAQGLLIPQIIALPPATASLLEDTLQDLVELGVDLEPMGGGSFALRALPTDVRPEDGQRFMEDLARQVRAEGVESGFEGRRHRICATVACHSAVRVNMSLDRTKMEWILKELLRSEDPYRCPHGRQTILRLGSDAIKKSFGRYW